MLDTPQARYSPSALRELLRHAPEILLMPVPLALLQPMFSRIAAHVAQSRPELFARLGPHAGKRFLIDPIDLPFVLVLTPREDAPALAAHRRHARPAHDAGIAGRFFDLLDMIDGSLDGDALFFSRKLCVTGDTEAVVALRNALDDFEGSALDSVVGSFGALAPPAALGLSLLRKMRGKTL
ncbi:ubiquinone anaerobic biosynthesis accessory factor UbiT [Bradyrhizobium sp.]|uniref:ubiquinone anaerobic biosynthesis accessory factor UbiT n=1 Tax=Bradyrhizobium sp. TaxID=376 RepID=UPI003C3233BC